SSSTSAACSSGPAGRRPRRSSWRWAPRWKARPPPTIWSSGWKACRSRSPAWGAACRSAAASTSWTTARWQPPSSRDGRRGDARYRVDLDDAALADERPAALSVASGAAPFDEGIQSMKRPDLLFAAALAVPLSATPAWIAPAAAQAATEIALEARRGLALTVYQNGLGLVDE